MGHANILKKYNDYVDFQTFFEKCSMLLIFVINFTVDFKYTKPGF